jgi:hypothetical protein
MIKNSQKGVSLIITFFVMVIILGVVLVISTLLYSQLKVIRNIGNSVVAFYAADSGVEKVLFYDRQVLPIIGTATVCTSSSECGPGKTCNSSNRCEGPAVRGLCSMLAAKTTSNNNPCLESGSGDQSIFCGAISPLLSRHMTIIDGLNPTGCNPDKCDNCEIYFKTSINGDKDYIVTARVTPDPNPDLGAIDLSIDSVGHYKDTGRAINTLIARATPQQIITVLNPSSTPRSATLNTTVVGVVARVKDPYNITRVIAYIKTSTAPHTTANLAQIITLSCTTTDLTDRTCTGGTSSLPVGFYYVDLDVFGMDASGQHELELLYPNVPPVS